jgi:hypothetical protein
MFVGLLLIALFPFVFHVLFLDVMFVIPCACVFLSIPITCYLFLYEMISVSFFARLSVLREPLG